jgi:undecaprenyl-diphosphatase
MIVAMAVTYMIGNLAIKNLVCRARPCWIDPTVPLLVTVPADYSFPSGHSMNGFAAALTLFFHDKRLGIPALVLAAIIAFSRLYNFVHFPTDVFVGIAIGTVVAIFVNHFMKAFWNRRDTNRFPE